MDKSKVRNGFNRIAPIYDIISSIGSLNNIRMSQIWLLTNRAHFSNTLILGGGTGYLLLESLKNNLSDTYCYVDISDAMTAAAKIKVQKQFPEKLKSIQFICASWDSIPKHEKFDLIVTPYVLDCLAKDELQIAMRTLYTRLTDKGTWYFADFNIPAKPIKKIIATGILKLLYLFFRIFCNLNVKTLADFHTEFNQLTLSVSQEKYFLGGLLVARIYRK